MKVIMRSLAMAAAVTAMAASAKAADLGGGLKDGGYVPAPASRSGNWTGFWIGALAGYEIANSKIDISETDWCVDNRWTNALSIDGAGQQGLFGELQIGYDYQFSPRLVGGLFGGLNLNGAEFSVDAHRSFSNGETTESEGGNLLSFQQEWGGVIGPRLGYLTSPSTMFYVAGGWAFGEMGKIKSGGKAVLTKANGFSHDQETSLSGWFGELGMETRLDGNLYLKVAGRYTSYESLDLVHESTGNAEHGSSLSASLDHDVLAAMAGLTYKFGGND